MSHLTCFLSSYVFLPVHLQGLVMAIYREQSFTLLDDILLTCKLI